MSEKQERPSADGQAFLIDAEIASGRYTNLIRIDARKEEFVLDMLVQSATEVILVGRFFLSPAHARRLHELLGRQIERQDRELSEREAAVAAPLQSSDVSEETSPSVGKKVTKKKAAKQKNSSKGTSSKKTVAKKAYKKASLRRSN